MKEKIGNIFNYYIFLLTGTSSSFLSSAVLALVTSSTLIALTETAEADRLRILALYMLLAVDGMAVSTIRMPMSMSMMLIPAATIAQVILTMPTTTMTPEPNERRWTLKLSFKLYTNMYYI